MNIKDMMLVLGLALFTTWALDRFVLSRFRPQEQVEQVSGQMFSAPTTSRTLKPLKREVDFIDAKRATKEVITEVETDWASLTFSSDGASLERLEFKRDAYGVEDNIITIFPAIEREHKAFLVALDERTPYYFSLVNKQDSDDMTALTYEGSFGDGVLRKTFKVYKNILKVDLTNEIVSKNPAYKTTIRVFVPSPVMPSVKNDQISGIFINASGSIEKMPYAKLNLQSGWWRPTIFGAENRYFIHSMVSDVSACIDRAYFDALPENKMTVILESVEMTSGSVCTASFYLGPKDEQAVAPVDSRLEETFEHSGMLAPLSKLLLRLLNFIYGYVHNYGYAIIILTILMRLFMLPFTVKGERSMKKGAEMGERMEYLKKKYKNDPERLRLEQAELIKKYGMPQVAGCLPMLLQFPIFIALNRVLSNSVELYQAPFIGWLQDLSAPDPYYILPILIMLSMLVNAFTLDAKQRSTMIIMAVALGAFSINFASGLLIYLIASTVLGVMQSYLVKSVRTA